MKLSKRGPNTESWAWQHQAIRNMRRKEQRRLKRSTWWNRTETKSGIRSQVYQSELNPRNRTSRKYIFWYLLQEIGIHGCGFWLGKSDICRAGCQKGQAGAEDAVHSWNYFSSFSLSSLPSLSFFILVLILIALLLLIFFFRKASVFILSPFNWLHQAHPDDLDNLSHLMSIYFRL